jgi:PPOX class probable F420-dependent enzyme
MPKLNSQEIDEFLTEPGHILRLATVDADGAPRVMPIWFIYEEGQIWMTPREKSVWGDNMRRDPRVAITVDEEGLPWRKVAVQGRAVLAYDLGEDDKWRDRYRRMGYRYMSREAVDAYVDSTDDQPRRLFAVDLGDSSNDVTSWRMPSDQEDISGIWAKRYYRPGTRMANNAETGEQQWKMATPDGG